MSVPVDRYNQTVQLVEADPEIANQTCWCFEGWFSAMWIKIINIFSGNNGVADKIVSLLTKQDGPCIDGVTLRWFSRDQLNLVKDKISSSAPKDVAKVQRVFKSAIHFAEREHHNEGTKQSLVDLFWLVAPQQSSGTASIMPRQVSESPPSQGLTTEKIKELFAENNPSQNFDKEVHISFDSFKDFPVRLNGHRFTNLLKELDTAQIISFNQQPSTKAAIKSFKAELRGEALTKVLKYFEMDEIINRISNELRLREKGQHDEQLLKNLVAFLQKEPLPEGRLPWAFSWDIGWLFNDHTFPKLLPYFENNEAYFRTVIKYMSHVGHPTEAGRAGRVFSELCVPHLKSLFPEQYKTILDAPIKTVTTEENLKDPHEVARGIFALHEMIEATHNGNFTEELFKHYYGMWNSLPDQFAEGLFSSLYYQIERKYRAFADNFDREYCKAHRRAYRAEPMEKQTTKQPAVSKVPPTLLTHCQRLDELLGRENTLSQLARAENWGELKRETREAYKLGARKFHPDKCDDKKVGQEKFRELFDLYTKITEAL